MTQAKRSKHKVAGRVFLWPGLEWAFPHVILKISFHGCDDPSKNFPKLRPVTEVVKDVGVTLLHPMFESNTVGKLQCTSELLGASLNQIRSITNLCSLPLFL